MTPVILLDDVSKSYQGGKRSGRIDAISHLSFEVENRSVVAVVGPSGCGKTTMLNLISGLDNSFEGRIQFSADNHKIGYMFQTPSLIPWRTVRDNATIGCEIEGKPKSEYSVRASALLDRYGLAEFADAYPYLLSQGMQQRVAFVRLLLYGANILLLDEPFSRLDYVARRGLYQDFHAVQSEEQITTLAVTHDIQEAVTLADKVVVLSPRPARVLCEVSIPLERSLRINSYPAALGEMAPYMARIWESLHSASLPGGSTCLGE